MATNIPLTGEFRITCEYKRKNTGSLKWAAGFHTGIDLVGDDTIYGTCDGTVTKIGWDNSYGNYITVKAPDGKYHWFCHLSKVTCNEGQKISRTTKIGIMGATGNVTGKHLHFEIRNSSNKYGDNSDPASYMGIPNKVGTYNTANYQIGNTSNSNSSNSTGELKTLNHNTNLREAPTTSAKILSLYIPNTTLYVLEPSVAVANGFTWDKVKIRVTGEVGYMINKNYK